MATAKTATRDELLLEDDPLWYKNAVIYQLHVRAFQDSDGDGIGDFKGLAQRLDYLQDLGVTAVWLLPFYPSPLKDDGYDIADYTGVHPAYGTLRDFKRFVDEAHRRGMRVITELVVNHTSDQHAWFERARRARRGSKWRDFYVWSDSPERYRDARIIFKDFETSNWSWDPVAKQYFWHRFYHHQPDLNFDNPAVHEALTRVLDFWLGLGVDGLRLDAVPYLYEREGTTCENLPETHAYLKKLRAHVDAKFKNRMLLAEANQWPEDTRAYFGEGDECHMAFNFPVMPRMYMAVQMEDRFPLIDILQQTPDIPDNAQWAVFLRNHDELTLEMVTDEERDYMYRVFAAEPRARINLGIRRRLAPLLTNNRRKIELLNGLLASLPGTPIIYYGDELGMGDNIYLGDRDGVRTPMQWSADRNAGFSRANPHKLYLPVNIDPEYRYESVNVAAQQNNPSSLLWWMRRLITLRQRHPAFGRGTIEFHNPENAKVLAFVRRTPEQSILVVANLSRFVQYAELDLPEFAGHQPIELFGRTRFPTIGELPYFLTLGPHGFYWLALEPPREEASQAGEGGEHLPTLSLSGSWESIFEQRRPKAAFEAHLPAVLEGRRWFGGKARAVQSVRVVDAVPVPRDGRKDRAWITLLEVLYTEGEPESYVLPLSFVPETHVEKLIHDLPAAALLRVLPRGAKGQAGLIYDASYDEAFARRLLELVGRRGRVRSARGELVGLQTRACRELFAAGGELTPSVSRAEQSNSSIVYGDRFILKLFRRAAPGPNPDWEIGRFLTERTAFPQVPAMAGALEYRVEDGERRTLGVLHELVPNEGDAWQYTLHQLGTYYEVIQSLAAEGRGAELKAAPPLAGLVPVAIPEAAYELIGPTLQNIELLGQRTAEMHLALASDRGDPGFAPEAFTPHYQRSLYQSLRNQYRLSLALLRKRRATLPESAQEAAGLILADEPALFARISSVKDRRIDAMRIRTHGDYHLGQVLFSGRDFFIIDFEGEPARSLTERRLKRSPLRDVAGMLRSFHYAAYAALDEHVQRYNIRADHEVMPLLEQGAAFWHSWVGAAWLVRYLELAEAPLLIEGRDASAVLLRAFMLEKAAYELLYELNNRPGWAPIPLRGMLDLMGETG